MPYSFDMWCLTYLCFFISAFVKLNAKDETEFVFKKCCPGNQSLIKVFEETGDIYECVDSESAKLNYDSKQFSRIIPAKNLQVQFGIPKNCTHLQVLFKSEVKLNIDADDNVCFDKLIAEISNGTVQNVPKTVMLACDESQNDTRQVFELNRIRKCCPEGQAFDIVHHACRDIFEANSTQTLLRLLNVEPKLGFDMNIGLSCKIEDFAVELSEDRFSLTLDGTDLVVIGTNGKTIVPFGEWCVEREYSNSILTARVCTRNCSLYDAYCVKKCCPSGYHYKPFSCNSYKSVCVPDEGKTSFDLSSVLDDLKADYDNIADVMGIGIGIKCPAGKYGLNKTKTDDEYWLTRDGKLAGNNFENDQFCLDTVDFSQCPQNNFELAAIACFLPEEASKNFELSAMANTLSAVFLFITLLVYCCLPELQNLHGRTVICHVSTMMLAYSCLARVQFNKVNNPIFCTVLAYGIYFGFVAAFFWLNVMCFDIWWTFGSVRTVQTMRKTSAERRRFIWYSIHAWGCTLVLTLTMYLLDFYHVSDLLDANMGRNHCWFDSVQNDRRDWPHYIFFVIPMGVLTSVNLVLWVLTARHCAQVKSEVHRLQAGSVGERVKKRFRIDRAKYLLTGKLWVVMGAGWFSELISTFFMEPPWLWAVVDLINELQGVFIFLLLVFKPKVYYSIKKRLGLVKQDPQKNGTSSGRTSSTFLSRTISQDERVVLRASLPHTDLKRA